MRYFAVVLIERLAFHGVGAQARGSQTSCLYLRASRSASLNWDQSLGDRIVGGLLGAPLALRWTFPHDREVQRACSLGTRRGRLALAWCVRFIPVCPHARPRPLCDGGGRGLVAVRPGGVPTEPRSPAPAWSAALKQANHRAL